MSFTLEEAARILTAACRARSVAHKEHQEALREAMRAHNQQLRTGGALALAEKGVEEARARLLAVVEGKVGP